MTLLLQKILEFYYRRKGRISPVRTIVFAFAAIILLGSGLLMLPAATKAGSSAGFMTALFTATSATCVTGLVLTETGAYWSFFGQVVILFLIQLGGLGFMTAISVFFFLLGRKIGLKERMVLAQSYSLNSLQGVVSLVKRAVLLTFSIEGIGAVVLTACFMRELPFLPALWRGVFHSVSAFCNAGFDILASVETGGSLSAFVTDTAVNITIMLLIFLGGFGFFALMDIFKNRSWRRFSLYTKLVIVMNGVLLFGGALLFLLIEWHNPATYGNLPVGKKILAAFFQAVTTRTAGFYTLPQGNLTTASLAVSDFLMFIGGSSGSTAGGIKTVTFCTVLLAVKATMQGKSRVSVFKKTVSAHQVRDAFCIVFLVLVLAFFGSVVISAGNGVPMSHAVFETVSALATVGLSTGITAGLNTVSRLILILFMFFGRVGIMTFSLALFQGNQTAERYSYAEEKIMIG